VAALAEELTRMTASVTASVSASRPSAADGAAIGKALFATYRGLQVRGDGCLADAHRAPELFEFNEAARRHLGAGDLALFRIPIRLNGEPGTHVIGCLVRHTDATGRLGFAGGAVAVTDRGLEAITTALPTARRLLDHLLEQGPALAFQEPAGRVEGAPRLAHTHDPENPVFHVGMPWEACEEPHLVSLLAHCCQHPELRERTVLIVDRARAGSRPFDWPFFEAIRQALSAHPDVHAKLTACQARLAQVSADARAAREELAARRADLQAAHADAEDAEQALAAHRGEVAWLRTALDAEQRRARARRGHWFGRSGSRGGHRLAHPAVLALIAGGVLLLVLLLVQCSREPPPPDAPDTSVPIEAPELPLELLPALPLELPPALPPEPPADES